MRVRIALSAALGLIACSPETPETTLGGGAPPEGGLILAHGTGEQRVALVRTAFGTLPLHYDVVGDLAIAQGDMVLGRAADLASRPKAASGLVDADGKWPDEVIPYYVDPSIDAQTQAAIDAAIADWQAKTSFRFDKYEDADDLPDDSVTFIARDAGCHSPVGRQGGNQEVNLQNYVDTDGDGKGDLGCSAGAVIHEIGHTIGLVHEQGRQDRDQYLTVNTGHALSGKEGNFDITSELDYGAFDWGSIMLYDSLAFSAKGEPTLIKRGVWSWRSGGQGTFAEVPATPGISTLGQYGDFDHDGAKEVFHADGQQWTATSPLTGVTTVLQQQTVKDRLAVGDFTGDGIADVLYMDGTKWLLSESGTGPLTVRVMDMPQGPDDVLFGDFDGDGRRDALYVDVHNGWSISYGCATPWHFVRADGAPLSMLAAGQFDDQPGDDVFIANGHTWSYVRNGITPLVQLQKSTVTRPSLAFGNFGGDARTEVLVRNGGLQASSGGSGKLGFFSNLDLDPSWYRIADIDGDGLDDFVADGLYDTNRASLSAQDVQTVNALYWGSWNVSFGGATQWQPINSSDYTVDQVHVADFTGDGVADVFRANGQDFALSVSGTGPWVHLMDAKQTMGDLLFGDFDGDTRTDVLTADGQSWSVAFGGTGGWQYVNTSGYTVRDGLMAGDFDRDGSDDVFLATGTEWDVSYSATSKWQMINTSAYVKDDGLLLADFDGDGRADVLRTDGSRWYLSSGGTSVWAYRNTSGYTADELLVGDFDADGIADLFHTGKAGWEYSAGAASQWIPLGASSGLPIDQLQLGDFDHDGVSDVFTTFQALVH